MGITCWDRIAIAGERRDRDLWRIEERYETVGGNAPNAAAAAALLGAPVHLLSALGDDRYGHQIQELWKEVPRFDFSLETSPATTISDLVIFPGSRQIYSDKPTFAIDPSENYRKLAERASIVDFYPGLFLEHIDIWYDYIQGARLARSASGLEEEAAAGRSWQILVDSLDIVDPPAEELLRELGTELLVLTEASQGGRLWTPAEGWRRFQTPSVQEADSVGAGDAFRGALLAGLHQGLREKDAVYMAARAGSLAASRRGGFPLGLYAERRA